MDIEIFGRTRNPLRLIPWALFFLFWFSFRQEINTFMTWIQQGENFDVFMRWFFWGNASIPPDTLHAYLILHANIVTSFLLFLIWLLMVSDQAILPVTRLREIFLTAIYLVLHFLGRHGMAAYVRNGKIKAWVEELQRTLPGVVAVDYNSAVSVERIVLPPGLFRGAVRLFRWLVTRVGMNLPSVRIQGAGLIFTLPDERIHGTNDLESHPEMNDPSIWMNEILGVVDLRNQARKSSTRWHPLSPRLGVPVLAYTRDGIEVSTTISVTSTLGQDPVPFFPLNVTYVGEQQPGNLQVVNFTTVSRRAGLFRVASFVDDLDERDRLEIHDQFQAITEWVAYNEPPRHPMTPIYNWNRVFSAIYARARHHLGLERADEIVPWFDLPVHVAIDLFREIISRSNYNEIIEVDGNQGRLGQMRGELASRMRNSGLLAYRPVIHAADEPLQKGQMYAATALLTVPPDSAFMLRNSRVLRDRGIRILKAGFGDLSVDERIYKHRLDHWRAEWDRETEMAEGEMEWESLRVRTQARIQAQQDFVQSLAQIYQANGNSKEILALKVLQALEAAISDPKTRQLLPEETFTMLRNIHDWMLPEDLGY